MTDTPPDADKKPVLGQLWRNPFERESIDSRVLRAWSASPLLHGIRASVAKKLVSLTHVRHFRSGEYLFREGEAGVAGALIISGRVTIQSGEKQLVTLSDGDFFGEVALLEDAPRTASAIAESDVQVSFLVRYQLEEFVRHRPRAGLEIMNNLARLLAARLHRINSQMSDS